MYFLKITKTEHAVLPVGVKTPLHRNAGLLYISLHLYSPKPCALSFICDKKTS